MVWEWSHTEQAYDNVQENIKRQSREWKEIVFAEWRAAQRPKSDAFDERFNERKYERALKWVKTPGNMTDEALDEFIWERANAQRNCDNGGYNAHCCPYGCGPHCVEFGRLGDHDDPDAVLQQGMDDDNHILHVRTHRCDKWFTGNNISELDGYDGDNYVAPDAAAMKQMVGRLREAGMDVNTFDGYDN